MKFLTVKPKEEIILEKMNIEKIVPKNIIKIPPIIGNKIVIIEKIIEIIEGKRKNIHSKGVYHPS